MESEKQPLLTERQVWKELARRLSASRNVKRGICHFLMQVEEANTASFEAVSGVRGKLRAVGAFRNLSRGLFYWPQTDAGRKERIAFCRRMAGGL